MTKRKIKTMTKIFCMFFVLMMMPHWGYSQEMPPLDPQQLEAMMEDEIRNEQTGEWPPLDPEQFEEMMENDFTNQRTPPPIEANIPFKKSTINVKQPNILDLLDLKNMEILDVLKLISQKSGRNIIASQGVRGKVTVYLKDIEVQEALKIIVDAYGWVYTADGSIIKIMTKVEYIEKYGSPFGQDLETIILKLRHANAADITVILDQIKSKFGKIIVDPKSSSIVLIDKKEKINEMKKIVEQLDIPIQSKVFALNYAKAEEVSAKVSDILTPSVGQIKYDTQTNTVIVSDTPQKLEEVTQVLDAFDQKHKEVHIEAKIMQIALNDEHKLGIDWEAMVSDFHNLDLVSDFDLLGVSEKRGKLSIGTLSSDNYTALIEALDTVGVTDILASPSITAINNHEAKILVGSTEPYVTSTTTTPASGPTTVAESVNFIEVGVKLYVTPTIHNDGFITMKIKPEISSVVSSLTTSNNNTIPIVETSEAETTVLVKDKVTIVIGGLIKDEKIATTKKIPILGDIPYLGVLFKSVTDKVSKTEIVIFLTPEIITGDVVDEDDDFI